MDNLKIIKCLLIIGGVVELSLGFLFTFSYIFLELIGIFTLPLFSQMAGTFVFFYGILLIYSSKDIVKYYIIPLINILIRGIMILFAILNVLTFPELRFFLLFAIIYDVLWSILVLFLMIKQGFILSKSKK